MGANVYPGPFCAKNEISKQMLMCGSSLPRLQEGNITNGLILELNKLCSVQKLLKCQLVELVISLTPASLWHESMQTE